LYYFWNPRQKKIFDGKKGEVIGFSFTCISIVPERYNTAKVLCNEGIQKYLNTGGCPRTQ
jgi:hypothetical protein